MKLRKLLSSLLVLILFAGCGTAVTDASALSIEKSALFTPENEDSDESYDEKTAGKISLNKDGAEAEGSGVTAEGSSVTITGGGTYVLSGELNDGLILVDTDDKVHLVFNGAKISSSSGPAILAERAGKLILTAYNGTKNEILSKGENADGKKGAVYCRDDLVINGSGELTVTSEDGDGIHGNDQVKIVNAIMAISADADGIDTNETVTVSDSILNITSGKDGMKAGSTDEDSGEITDQGNVIISGGVINITSEDDGISVTGDVTVTDGSLNIIAGSGYEYGENRTEEFSFGFGQGNSRPGSENIEDWEEWDLDDYFIDFDDEDLSEYEDFFNEIFGNGGSWSEFFDDDDNEEEDYGWFFDSIEKEKEEEPENKTGRDRESGLEGKEDSDRRDSAWPDFFEREEEIDDSFFDSFPEDGSYSDEDLESLFEYFGLEDDLLFDDEGKMEAKGIRASGDIRLSGTVSVNSADDALSAGGSITFDEGTLEIMSGDDALRANDSLTVNGGKITVKESYEGIEATHIVFNGGEVEVNSDDDGINSADKLSGKEYGMEEADGSTITINGGTILITSDGDGIDSNGSIVMNGGSLTIYGPESEFNSAIDYTGSFTLNQGTVIAGGSSRMAMAPDQSTVGMIRIRPDRNASSVEIRDESGKTLLRYETAKKCSDLIIASDLLEKGKTYTVLQDGTEIGKAEISETISEISAPQSDSDVKDKRQREDRRDENGTFPWGGSFSRPKEDDGEESPWGGSFGKRDEDEEEDYPWSGFYSWDDDEEEDEEIPWDDISDWFGEDMPWGNSFNTPDSNERKRPWDNGIDDWRNGASSDEKTSGDL